MFGSSLLVAQDNPWAGTWKLNVAKSKYTPGPGPQSATRTYEAQAAGVKSTQEVTAADGSHASVSFTANFDGKDYPLTGSSAIDAIALKRSGNTFEWTLKKGGKVVSTGKNTVSNDGKVMTYTAKGTNAKGEPTSSVQVFDKQ
jgi:hypothetical protein